MTKTRFLALITALALLLTIPTAVFAQNTIPHVFLGTASLDGAIAVDGTAITAWVDGQQVAATNIAGGSYQLVIGGAAGFAGETVVFRVGSANAAETADWTMGGADVLNLTASSQGATTAPPPGGAGDKGDKGDRGNTGAAGAAGSAGPAGPAGSSGSDGRAGSDGATGETGAAGSPGSPGVAGEDGGGGAIGVIALILAIVAIVAAGGAYMMGRRA